MQKSPISYPLQNVDSQLGSSDTIGPGGALGKLPSHKSELLAKLARTTPYYKRNRAHICSFWVKGECKRGEECPYRHEKPSDPDDPLSTQNMKDRYYGINDPVAEKILKRAQAMPHLDPPEDRMITTLYVGGLDPSTSENDIRSAFYSYGEMRSVTLVQKQGRSDILVVQNYRKYLFQAAHLSSLLPAAPRRRPLRRHLTS